MQILLEKDNWKCAVILYSFVQISQYFILANSLIVDICPSDPFRDTPVAVPFFIVRRTPYLLRLDGRESLFPIIKLTTPNISVL